MVMEAARTSERLVNFYQTARRYNPEDSHLPNINMFTNVRTSNLVKIKSAISDVSVKRATD
jgi:hypothetical protein